MNVNQLPKITTRSKKTVGRGIGSGKGGHTTGRGNKGQLARERISTIFEGTKFKKSLIKRLPFQRGKVKFKAWGVDPIILNVQDLAGLSENFEVTVDSLIKKGLVTEKAKQAGVKILGQGEVKTKLIVKVPTSSSAASKITSAGGKIEA